MREKECECVCVFDSQLQCEVHARVFLKAERQSGDLMESGSTAHFQRAVWHSLEGMRGWITLLGCYSDFPMRLHFVFALI